MKGSRFFDRSQVVALSDLNPVSAKISAKSLEKLTVAMLREAGSLAFVPVAV